MMHRMTCGRKRRHLTLFIDCQEPDTTTPKGVRCKTCGVEVSALEWDLETDLKMQRRLGRFPASIL